MDFAIAKGFCTRYAIAPFVFSGERELLAQLPFCWVRIFRLSSMGRRSECRTTIESEPGVALSSPQSLSRLRYWCLSADMTFALGGHRLNFLSRPSNRNNCLVQATLYEINRRPREMFQPYSWRGQWSDTGGPEAKAIVRAAHDVMRGAAPYGQFLDWLVEQGEPDLEKALQEVYG